MWGRWCVYLLTLAFSVVFYGFYREWFSWLLLQVVIYLPWFSLVVSLPAMLTAKCRLHLPESARMDMPVRPTLEVTGWLPALLLKSRLQVRNKLTDETTKTKPGKRLPTEHCGYLQITYDTVLIGDYLGLWRRRLRKGESVGIYIEPKPVICDLPEQLQSRSVSLWKPKPGGGFSENHDLRLYRPGDDLRSIHWKMTAKTGKLIYREPIVPAQQGYLLTMTLCGDPDTLDKKLGQLLYVSEILLKRQIPHGVCCRTGEGTVEFSVTDVHSMKQGLHQLLQSAPAVGETDFRGQNVLWQYHIGGDGNEER